MQSQLARLTARLEQRLLRGEHLTLHGPRGSGKSTVLIELHARLRRRAVACAYSPCATALDDITRALERAYPGVSTLDVGRRTARVRLWYAADRRAGVLLLDHFRCNGSATVSFLRRLHGKIAGVLTAVDVDSDKERIRLQPWRYGATSVRMPLAGTRHLRRLLDERWTALGLKPLDGHVAHTLVAAARGRPGWIMKCTQLACEPRYWCARGPLVTVLCVDAEVATRYEAPAVAPTERAARRVQRLDQEEAAAAVSARCGARIR